VARDRVVEKGGWAGAWGRVRVDVRRAVRDDDGGGEEDDKIEQARIIRKKVREGLMKADEGAKGEGQGESLTASGFIEKVGGNKPSSNPTSALPQHDSDNNDNDDNNKKAAEQDNPVARMMSLEAELKLLSTALGVRGPSPPPQAGAPPSAPASPGPSGGRDILASSFAAAAALDGR